MDLSDIDVFCTEYQRDVAPSGHTELIASVCFGAGPGGGDYRDYLLETDELGQEFTLWIQVQDEWTEPECDEDTDDFDVKYIYSLEARGNFESSMPRPEVAARLLEAAWRFEAFESGNYTDFNEFSVEKPAILSEKKLYELALKISGMPATPDIEMNSSPTIVVSINESGSRNRPRKSGR